MKSHMLTSLVVLFGIGSVCAVFFAYRAFPFEYDGALMTTIESIFLYFLGLLHITVSLVYYGRKVFDKWVFQIVSTVTLIQLLNTLDIAFYGLHHGFKADDLHAFGLLIICFIGCKVSWSEVAYE